MAAALLVRHRPRVFGVLLLFVSTALAQGLESTEACSSVAPSDALPAAEAVVIEEVYRMVDEVGENIWPGFSAVPFPIVLVGETSEALIGWEKALPEGFADAFESPRLGRVAVRPRVFTPGLTAAFPAFGPPAVVVIGTMDGTARTPGAWALTLLHEHFHQLQYAAPHYDRDVAALDLAGDDTSGMWMLNYPFPYQEPAVGALFGELAAEIRRALAATAPTHAAWAALDRLVDALAPADARYLGFQLWQEGVGRHVELRAAEVAATSFEPGAEFAALDGFAGWRPEEAAVRDRILGELESVALAEQGRVSFYPVGAALAMLLDRQAPEWRRRYLDRRFTLERPPVSGVEITYLANEGFLLAAGRFFPEAWVPLAPLSTRFYEPALR